MAADIKTWQPPISIAMYEILKGISSVSEHRCGRHVSAFRLWWSWHSHLSVPLELAGNLCLHLVQHRFELPACHWGPWWHQRMSRNWGCPGRTALTLAHEGRSTPSSSAPLVLSQPRGPLRPLPFPHLPLSPEICGTGFRKTLSHSAPVRSSCLLRGVWCESAKAAKSPESYFYRSLLGFDLHPQSNEKPPDWRYWFIHMVMMMRWWWWGWGWGWYLDYEEPLHHIDPYDLSKQNKNPRTDRHPK